MQLIKIIVIIASLGGFYLRMKKKLDIKEEFIPIVLFSCITVIEFLAGILNCMKLVTVLIAIIGIVFGTKEVLITIKEKKRIHFSLNIVFFGIMVILFTYLLKGRIFVHYDNFSHWATIAREMLLKNKLPNFQSQLIMFQAYPPGTACFIYFICKFLGNSESKMLFAQSIIILSGMYTLFAFGKKKEKINYLILIVTCIYLLISNIFITDLLVDTVLPVLGIAGFMIIIYYRNDCKKGLFYSIPILSTLILVKNSGIFFVIVDIIVWLWFFIKNNGVKSIFCTKYVAIILIPILLQCLFKWHVDLVFEKPEFSKHSMSVSNYLSNLKNKNKSDILEITKSMIKEMIDLKENKENIIIVILFVMQILMLIIGRKDEKLRKYIIRTIILYLFIYTFYQISLLGMYIFSMPINEAKTLASFSRYYRTIVQFEYGIVVIALLNFLDKIQVVEKKKNIIIKVIFLFLLAIPMIFYTKQFKKQREEEQIRYNIRCEILKDIRLYQIELGKKYLIYLSDNIPSSDDFVYVVSRYDLQSPNVKVIQNITQLESNDELYNYDYLIVLRKTDEINDILNKFEGDVEKNVIKLK